MNPSERSDESSSDEDVGVLAKPAKKRRIESEDEEDDFESVDDSEVDESEEETDDGTEVDETDEDDVVGERATCGGFILTEAEEDISEEEDDEAEEELDVMLGHNDDIVVFNDEEEYESDAEIVAEPGYIYVPSSKDERHPHPGDIVQSKVLASVEPHRSYKLGFNIDESGMSLMQYETVQLICQKHQERIGTGVRAGFLLGDGAGVGKTRTVAGVFKENCIRGRQIAAWFTCSYDLTASIKQNLLYVGQDCDVVKLKDVQNSWKCAKPTVIVCTYTSLVGKPKADPFEKLLNHLGVGFSGLIVLDESHKAKNCIEVKNAGGGKKKDATQTGQSVLKLQTTFKKARIVYCSATPISMLTNFAYLTRLGLWGPETLYADYQDFAEGMGKKGVGGVELLARDLKEQGYYVARQINFSNFVFQNMCVQLTTEFEFLYNTSAEFWFTLQSFCPSKGPRVKIANFWSCHQRYFISLILASKVPDMIELARGCLDRTCSVVIGLQSTGEAVEKKRKNGGQAAEVAKSTAMSIIHDALDCCELLWDTETSSIAAKARLPCDLANKLIILNDLYKKLLPVFPSNPLDQIIDNLGGPTNVAELTGRSQRRVTRRTNGSYNITETNSFQRGEKFVAVISSAASVGISLHSEKVPRYPQSGRKRVHATLELPWSADKLIQQLGRTNRSNQKSNPLYVLFQSPVPGEIRLVKTVLSRLQMMGAFTNADRNSAKYGVVCELGDNDADLKICLKSYINHKLSGTHDACLKKIHDYFLNCSILKTNKKGVLKAASVSSEKFFNKILGLDLVSQDQVLQGLIEAFQNLQLKRQKDGITSEGIKDLQWVDRIAKTAKLGRLFHVRVQPDSMYTMKEIVVDRGMAWCDQWDSDETSEFYQNSKSRIIMLRRTVNDRDLADIYFASCGHVGKSFVLELELKFQYQKVTTDLAKKFWEEEFQRFANYACSHAAMYGTCNLIGCQHGCRFKKYYIVCGDLDEISNNAPLILQPINLVNVKLGDGEHIFGALVPAKRDFFNNAEMAVQERVSYSSL